MKSTLKQMLADAIENAYRAGALPSDAVPPIEIEVPKNIAHGDFAANTAMVSARLQKMAPRKIAEAIVAHLTDDNDLVDRIEIAGPGFINFHIRSAAWHPIIGQVFEQDERYGAGKNGQGRKIQVEFVSANPTGPLHVGHGRGAAVGDATAAILAFCGWQVQKEYYVNDSGRQIRTLGRSVYLRFQQRCGRQVSFPDDCYQGDYIRELADVLAAERGDELTAADEETGIDICARFAASAILDGIRQDLDAFGVGYDRWFSEQSLYDSGQVDAILSDLQDQGIIYEHDGARWFKTTDFGDEKDRVVVRRNGLTTYFASDIAYHQDKYRRGFDKVIDVWGADHHGYIPRMSAAVQAGGRRADQFTVILVQLVNLLRGGQPVAMSTRAGEFVTLKDVVDEVGRDAARFIFLTRAYDSPLDFDLDVAKQKTNDNPVYYVQYVHARIASIVRKHLDRGGQAVQWSPGLAAPLTAVEEIVLIKALGRFPDVVRASAETLAPHRVTYYLMELAGAFHAYYNRHRVLVDEPDLARARLALVVAVQKVIRNGLTLLGVSAPARM